MRVRLPSSDARIDYGTMIITMLGDKRITSTPDGRVTDEVRVSAGERFTPFAQSAAHVVRAALAQADVEKVGTEKVRGTSTTHYRVELSATSRAALSRLPKTETFWFDLETPGDIATVDVWVTPDNLIRRIQVPGDRNSTTEFWDLGSTITIKRPGR